MGVIPEDRHLLQMTSRARKGTKQEANTRKIRNLAKSPDRLAEKGNRWEKRHGLWLEQEKKDGRIFDYAYEPFSIALPGFDHRYVPDFVVWTPEYGRGSRAWVIELHEVKGHLRAIARNKMKAAAAAFPCFQFVMAFDGDQRIGTCPFELVYLPRGTREVP